MAPALPPDPEVAEKARRRTFTAEYKVRILGEVDAARASGVSGAIGAILRREGLYSGRLSTWEGERRAGSLAGLTPRKRGRRTQRPDPSVLEAAQLRREVASLRQRLERAELIIDVQKKVSALLGIPLKTVEDGESE